MNDFGDLVSSSSNSIEFHEVGVLVCGGYSYIDLETVLQPAKKGKGPSINKEDLEKCLRAEFKLQVFFFYKSSFKKSMFEMYILPLKKVSVILNYS